MLKNFWHYTISNFKKLVLWALEISKCQQLKKNLVVIKFVNIPQANVTLLEGF
jgi:hypothetical protein